MRFSKFFSLCLTMGALGAGACCPPENVSVVAQNLNGKCEVDIDYEGTALGVYVAAPDTKFPRSRSEFTGTVYFGLDTTTFPDGIIPPVRYGDETKERSVPTKLGTERSDPYPMPLEDLNGKGLSTNSKESVGPFKVGVVTVPGNTETDPITDFQCPAPGDQPVQYGVELPIHRGVED